MVDTKNERKQIQIAADRYTLPESVPDSSQLICMYSAYIV